MLQNSLCTCVVPFHTLTHNICVTWYVFLLIRLGIYVLAVIYVLRVCFSRYHFACNVMPHTTHCIALNHCIQEFFFTFCYDALTFFVLCYFFVMLYYFPLLNLCVVALLFCVAALLFVGLPFVLLCCFSLCVLTFVTL